MSIKIYLCDLHCSVHRQIFDQRRMAIGVPIHKEAHPAVSDLDFKLNDARRVTD